ncbi:MAG: Poly-beta-1,6-N-acetyl-D-glucosamine N-deacetylase precursor [Syntrophorhabdaceae bacterium PtaU1.Bin034]|jgi:biofilm PGA synthesis lipoprotein PgaB|nr:MAG: Poly-beta-1,6-N-acetyl-D-glucosamine N-deacetylase precursor [Syntrophorhabdaceae bacterium PtaU1.Bin034]
MCWKCFLPLTNTCRILLAALLVTVGASLSCAASDKVVVVAYHDITREVVAEEDITPEEFIEQLDFFRTNGYRPVSISDVEAAARGQKPLPDKAILLTFDDGYISFYQVVYPALKVFNFPAVLSVVTSWADGRANPDGFYRNKKFMTWDQIREVADSGLVTIASHTDSLHRHVRANPQGNVEAAMTTFIFDEKTGSYEAEDDYRRRIASDFARSLSIFQQNLGFRPTALTWPYGAYNELAIEEAKKFGFRVFLTLDDGLADIKSLDRMKRYYAQTMLYWVPTFKEELTQGLLDQTPIRGVQIDLDKIIDPDSYENSDRNLGKCLDRLVALGVNTVIVQGFCDTEGTGNVKSVYFHNTVLPVRMDFLSHAINRIKSREIQAYVWMPSLSFLLPNQKINADLQVREFKDGRIRPSTSSYKRLSPFDPRSLAISSKIFRDLAAYVDFDGILFQDDAYLTDEEDFHPSASEAFKKAFGKELTPANAAKAGIKPEWIRLKTEAIDRYISELVKTVRTYRPPAKIARNIYSEVVTNPTSREWFSQSLESYLQNYDYTVIMAYPQMEKVGSRAKIRKWMLHMVSEVKKHQGNDKVVFKIQAFDWQKNTWIKERTLKEELSYLLSLGARHIAYYPDGVVEDRPKRNDIADIISGQEFIRNKGRTLRK